MYEYVDLLIEALVRIHFHTRQRVSIGILNSLLCFCWDNSSEHIL